MKSLKFIFLITTIFSINISCSKDDQVTEIEEPGEIVQSTGISADAFETYPGDLGLVLDTREIAKKGYKPTKAEIIVAASEGDFSRTITIDPISFMAQIKISKEGLSEAVIAELTSGVNVSSIIKDENGNILLTDEGTISFQPNPTAKTVNANNLQETTENAKLNLSEDTFYYFQVLDADGNPTNSSMMHNSNSGFDNVMWTNSDGTFNGNEISRNFSFIPVSGEPNTFFIKLRDGGRFLSMASLTQNSSAGGVFYQHLGPSISAATELSQVQNNNNTKFKIVKLSDSVYELQTYTGIPIRLASGIGLTTNSVVTSSSFSPPINSDPITWRLISTTIDWTVENEGTTFLDPILGQAITDFKFNSTLINCGQGSLSQTVGVKDEEKENGTVGWEESLSINTTNSVGVSATVGVSFDAKFFGTGATYNASLTLNYNYSRSVTETNSTFEEKSKEISKTTFAERTVTVPSGSASLVYDAFQFYDSTRINFVQRLRIRGVDSQTGQSLSGEEIRSQFHFSGFNGVITAVDQNSIVITLRGTTILDKIIETESNVQNVAANCN
ncbi:hypothetical protein [Aquimarina sp. SS2-1]|uniref:hypothetical protein n=1 Tax=Aquimarina besae TaxID=3342247 RepID=UPI00366EE368